MNATLDEENSIGAAEQTSEARLHGLTHHAIRVLEPVHGKLLQLNS
jgi:hypothetical protein